MRNKLVSGAADILAGIGVLVLFVAGDTAFHVAADLREGVVTLALLCLLAGFVRGQIRPGNPWLKGFLVMSGGSLALLIVGWDQIQHAILGTLLLTANLFAVCGVHARRLWSQSAAKGAMMLAAPLAAFVVLAMATIPTLAARVATRRTIGAAPPFSISKPDGTTVSSAGLRGRVVILDFWATWCPACRRELPELEALYQRYRDNPKVSFWALDSLENGETAENAKEFIRKAGYTLPVAFDREKGAEGLGVDGLPKLIVLDKSGRIRLVHTGYDLSEKLETELAKEIEKLLGEPL